MHFFVIPSFELFSNLWITYLRCIKLHSECYEKANSCKFSKKISLLSQIMKQIALCRTLLSVCFALVVMHTVSFHEVHYLFAQHEQHEHCENHLHAKEHYDCAVCKFEASVFSDDLTSPQLHILISFSPQVLSEIQSAILQNTFRANFLRGPPSLG